MFSDWRTYAFLSAAFAAFAAFAALTAIFGKIGVNEINSNLATFIRTIVILFVTAVLISYRKEWILPEVLNKKSVGFLVLSGFATGASWLCYYRALQLGPASKVAPIDKLSVVFVILLSILFLDEKLELKTVLGGLLIAIGSVIIAL